MIHKECGDKKEKASASERELPFSLRKYVPVITPTFSWRKTQKNKTNKKGALSLYKFFYPQNLIICG